MPAPEGREGVGCEQVQAGDTHSNSGSVGSVAHAVGPQWFLLPAATIIAAVNENLQSIRNAVTAKKTGCGMARWWCGEERPK